MAEKYHSSLIDKSWKKQFCHFALALSEDVKGMCQNGKKRLRLAVGFAHQKANALPPPVVIVYAACWFFYLFSKEADGVARCELEQKCKPIRQKL